MTQVQQLVAIAAQLTIIAAALGGVLLWFKKWLRQQVSEPLGRVETEVTPNGGASMNDAVARTERAVTVIAQRFEDHLRTAHGGPAVAPVVVVERPARDA
jgi:triacylglycerol esterase/lipase EstA (alpha/beta hydrolase family)